jgi:hypothetical protein
MVSYQRGFILVIERAFDNFKEFADWLDKYLRGIRTRQKSRGRTTGDRSDPRGVYWGKFGFTVLYSISAIFA